MDTLICNCFPLRQSPFSLSSILASTKKPCFTHSGCQRCTWKPKPVALFFSTFASSDPDAYIYGGWEELDRLEDSGDSGILAPFRSFVISLGIGNKKHAMPFLMGFCAALAVSRIRFSTIALLPVSILLFLGGFTIGAAQAGFAVKKMGRNGGGFEAKLRHLEALFCDVDVKMSDLSKGLEGGINVDELQMDGTESYLQIIEYVRAAVGEAQKVLTDSFSNDLFKVHTDFDFGAKKMNQKSSRKRTELRASGIDFFQFLTGILHEPLIGSKTAKPKDSIKEKLIQQLNPVDANDPSSEREMVTGNGIGGCSRSSLRRFNQDDSKVDEYGTPNDKQARTESKVAKKDRSGNSIWDNGDCITTDVYLLNRTKCNIKIGCLGKDIFLFDEDLDNQSSSLPFTSRHGSFQKVVVEQNYERGAFDSYFDDSADGDIGQKRTDNMEYLTRESKSALHEHTLKIKNSAHELYFRSESSELKEKQMNGLDFEENAATLRNHSSLYDQQPTNPKDDGKGPYPSKISTDEKFEHNIKVSTYLLKCAREYMMTQTGEEKADAILYKAADLLSASIVMKPMSLVAVGQLGNTYLLHGELKLKVTQELRTLLLRSVSLLNGKSCGLPFKKFDNIVTSREDIASVIVTVCEECECLLVEAGRKYRRALSIDGNDVRALYNWGIALCLRAQLIADVGPEAAMEADEIYLAAIDKFNAMMSGSNAYASDALYRWGVALQQRSHLRPKNSREKEKLLHQAKSLFEEVLSMDSDNERVKQALISCLSELNYRSQL